MCADMCVDVCVDMCAGMCVDTCAGMQTLASPLTPPQRSAERWLAKGSGWAWRHSNGYGTSTYGSRRAVGGPERTQSRCDTSSCGSRRAAGGPGNTQIVMAQVLMAQVFMAREGQRVGLEPLK